MLRVTPLPPSAACDVTAIAALAEMVNIVYAVGEAGLWAEDVDRTGPDDLATFVRAGELAVARRDDEIVGCVRVHRIDARTGGLGMLTAHPEHRGMGVGRELVRFAERTARAAEREVMELQLLVPREGMHPVKEFLAAWYERLGYRIVARSDPAIDFPNLRPLLAGPCLFLVYRKDLRPAER